MITTINPTNGKEIKSYDFFNINQVKHITEEQAKFFPTWRDTSFKQRSEPMINLANLLIKNKLEYAKLMTLEMGKPLTQAIAEIEKCATLANFYAENAENFLQDKIVKTDNTKSYISYRPQGIIFAIMPWNFPFWQVMRFAAPNLMGGNLGLLKHAPNCFGVACKIEELFLEAGFPEFCFKNLIIDTDLVPEIIADHNIKGVTITGSERAGRSVAKHAGENLKKIVLELGGSDPYIILKDADLELAAEICVNSRMANCGQVCIAAKRLIVVDAVRDKFVELVKDKMEKFIPNDPLLENTNLGPMAREDLRETLDDQVKRAIKEGVNCIMGGNKIAGPGFYYEPTIFLDVKPDDLPYKEEFFGPVLSISYAKDEDEAIKLANHTQYGLGAAVFTQDLSRGENIARNKLDAGACFVNSQVSSNIALPFGGTKQSGFGRELGEIGIHEFMNMKTVVVK